MLLFTQRLVRRSSGIYWGMPTKPFFNVICHRGLRQFFPEIGKDVRQIWLEFHTTPSEAHRVCVEQICPVHWRAIIDETYWIIPYECTRLLAKAYRCNHQQPVYVQIMYQPAVKRAPRTRKK